MKLRRLLLIIVAFAGAFVLWFTLAKEGGTPRLQRFRVQLDWVPEPEFGGLFAAQAENRFADLGMPLEIIQGAASLATPQILAQGVCDVALMGGDQLVTARAQGADIVAVYATFLESPYGLMAHDANPAKNLEELWTGGNPVAVEDGLPYVRLLNSMFGTSGAQFVPYAGSLAPFEADPLYSQQCFVTAEPVQMRLKGIQVKVFSVSKYYDPYVAVYAVRGETLRESPELVGAFVAALRAGWVSYLESPASFTPAIAKMNPAMTVEAMNIATELEGPLIRRIGMADSDLGRMTFQKWKDSIAILEKLDMVKDGVVNAADCFANFPPDVDGDDPILPIPANQ
ncbi:MAG: ABC transporter substrate-binding protein [Planctomycetota bacterium]|nr:ABC transporter substrate-binding protein [Planctomycetota bacterium]